MKALNLSTQYHIVARIHLQCAQWRRKIAVGGLKHGEGACGAPVSFPFFHLG